MYSIQEIYIDNTIDNKLTIKTKIIFNQFLNIESSTLEKNGIKRFLEKLKNKRILQNWILKVNLITINLKILKSVQIFLIKEILNQFRPLTINMIKEASLIENIPFNNL